MNEELNKISDNRLGAEKKSKGRLALKVILIFFLIFLSFYLCFEYVIPNFLAFLNGDDITAIKDSDMMLDFINVKPGGDSDNAYYDLIRIKDFLNDDVAVVVNSMFKKYIQEKESLDNKKVAAFLDENYQILDIYFQAAKKEKFQNPFSANSYNIFSEDETDFVAWKNASKLSCIKTLFLAKNNQLEAAYEEAFNSIRLGDLIINSQNDMITLVIGISIKENGLAVLEEIVKVTPLIEDAQLDEYRRRIDKYGYKINLSPWKVEYLTKKRAVENLKNGFNGYKGVSPRDSSVENNFYFKPNLTELNIYNLYSQIIKELEKPCGEEMNEVKSDINIDEYSSLLGMLKAYFTENITGKLLFGTIEISFFSVKERMCEMQLKIDDIKNELNNLGNVKIFKIAEATDSQKKAFLEMFVDNLREGIYEGMIDSDNDGVPDDIEKILNTNIDQADSDGDGYNDKEEIIKGFNPIGEGVLTFDILSESLSFSFDGDTIKFYSL